MFPELTTPRLVLRQLRAEDAVAVFAYRGDPAVSGLQSWEPASVDDVCRLVAGLADSAPDTPGTWFQLAITIRGSGTVAGDCGLRFPAEDRHQAEVGLTLAPEHQGQGLATEALTAVLAYLFDQLGKHRVFAGTDPRNATARALLERVGMRQEAHFRESLWFKGGWADDLVFAMLDREWRSRSSPVLSRPGD